MDEYCTLICENHNRCGKVDLLEIENDVRTSGAEVIRRKGATYYAIALSVRRICESLLKESPSVLTLSGMLRGEYGISDVCMSIPFVVNSGGIQYAIPSPLLDDEQAALHNSADALKQVIQTVHI